MKQARRLSPSMVVASIALFVALSGAGYAAVALPQNSVGTPQLKAGAVTATKVKNFSLLRNDFKPGELPAGAQGPAGAEGPQGPQGTTGAQGPAGPAGPQGAKGDQGPIGPAGATGATGAQGPSGVVKVLGFQGSFGPQRPRATTATRYPRPRSHAGRRCTRPAPARPRS